MPTFVEMDSRLTLSAQMEQEVGPVVLINLFTVNADEARQLLKAWAVDAAWMKQQPGFISTQLHRGIGGDTLVLGGYWTCCDRNLGWVNAHLKCSVDSQTA